MGTAVNVALTLAALEGAEALQHVSLNELSTAKNSTAFMVRSVRFTVGPSRPFARIELKCSAMSARRRRGAAGCADPRLRKGIFQDGYEQGAARHARERIATRL